MNPLDYAKQIAYSSEETLRFTYDMSIKYKDKPGCYVECGVAAGAQVIAMAYGAPDKTIYAYDSFEGIPLPSNRDDQMPGIMMLSESERKSLPDPGKQELKTTGATSVSIDDFMSHVKASGVYTKNIKPLKGWFENTVQNHTEPIAILRLDGDLYNSTYVCLKYLFPLVINGGLIIIDDIQLSGCKEAVLDYFESIGRKITIYGISNIGFFTKI